MNAEVILLALLALPQYAADRDDSPEARCELYRPVAVAIAETARTPEQAAALITQAWHETRLARYVLEGRCQDGPRGARCDPDKHGVPRARGPWQLWRAACKADDLRGQAKCVLGTMQLGLARCASWAGAFYALRGHWACGEDAAREQTMRGVLARWGKR